MIAFGRILLNQMNLGLFLISRIMTDYAQVFSSINLGCVWIPDMLVLIIKKACLCIGEVCRTAVCVCFRGMI